MIRSNDRALEDLISSGLDQDYKILDSKPSDFTSVADAQSEMSLEDLIGGSMSGDLNLFGSAPSDYESVTEAKDQLVVDLGNKK